MQYMQLRVSGVVSNAAYVLVLDCDMSCNNRASAMDAMCFLLDRSPPAPQNLAFVQFPQMFHNLSHNDKVRPLRLSRGILTRRWRR